MIERYNKTIIANHVFEEATRKSPDWNVDGAKPMDIWRTPSPTTGMALSEFGVWVLRFVLDIEPYILYINKPLTSRFKIDVATYVPGMYYLKSATTASNVFGYDPNANGAELHIFDRKMQTWAALASDAHSFIDALKFKKS